MIERIDYKIQKKFPERSENEEEELLLTHKSIGQTYEVHSFLNMKENMNFNDYDESKERKYKHLSIILPTNKELI